MMCDFGILFMILRIFHVMSTVVNGAGGFLFTIRFLFTSKVNRYLVCKNAVIRCFNEIRNRNDSMVEWNKTCDSNSIIINGLWSRIGRSEVKVESFRRIYFEESHDFAIFRVEKTISTSAEQMNDFWPMRGRALPELIGTR